VSWPPLHDRLLLIALLAGAPPLVVVVLLLDEVIGDPIWYWLIVTGLAVWLVAGLLLLRSWFVYRLGTAANLMTAIRQGDLTIRARHGRRDGAYGSLILELNALAEALQEQRLDDMEAVSLLRNVLGEIDVAVFAFDGAGRLRMLNGAAERLLGKTADTAVGRDAGELGLADCLTGEPDRTLELDLPGGKGRWGMRRGGYRHLGRPRRLVILSNLNRALRAEELAAWKRLIRVMSHELNNSLAPIRSLAGSLGRLVETDPLPEAWEDDLRAGLRVIASRAEALNRFVGAYAALAKLPDPRPEPVAVERLVRRVAELETRLKVEVEPGPEIVVHADRDQLEQMLINLVRNAVDASLETGGAVRVAWKTTGRRLEVSVLDEGPGLSETANLFVPFYSTRAGGTGVGLVLCRQIAEGHGGSVTLANRAGGTGGCEARVVLPLEPLLEA
jgi:nitrogen fixation/metabolism regulation signal transduction histidine kinase